MSPLDDELRAALHGRAAVLTPSPDPLAGIETRAWGMRRRRVAASVVGAAVAVTAIAVAVPSLTTGAKQPSGFATQRPTAVDSSSLLDPAHPWAFRGTPLTADALATFRRDWASVHPGSILTPLFAQVYEPSGKQEAVFVATGADGDRYGYVTGTQAGASFPVDFAYGEQRALLRLTLPGDEVPRVLALVAPDNRLQISRAGSAPAPMAGPAPGVGLAPLEGSLTVTAVTAGGAALASETVDAADISPTNLVDWTARGSDESTLLAKARAAAAPSLPGSGEVLLQVVFAGSTDSQVRYVMGQVWRRGDALAHSFAYAEGGTNGPSTFFGPVTPTDPKVLAFVVDSLPGTTTDLLVVVPAPRTSQVLYDNDATGAFMPVSTDGTDGVVLVDRSRTASADRLQLLTGNGDPATDVTFQGQVASLLCGAKECG